MSTEVLSHGPTTASFGGPTRAPRARRKPAVPSGVVAMLIFVLTEIMFFAGLISAFVIVKAQAPGGLWPPPGQPRLPASETAINTVALIASGFLLWHAQRKLAKSPAHAGRPLLAAIALGAAFVWLQGVEWAALLAEGLTFTSSSHGSFFYLIIGTHALHAVVALGALGWCGWQLHKDKLKSSQLWTAAVFWYFVVGVWPFLYVKVYL